MDKDKEKQLTLKEENPVIPEHVITDKREINAVMYLFLNRDLHMSTGKAAAQVAHAAVQAYKLSKPELIQAWENGLHYTKLVMLARDFEHLSLIQSYLDRRGFKTELIIDEGMTEVDAHVATALGVEIVDKNDPHVKATFETFSLYRDLVRINMEFDR